MFVVPLKKVKNNKSSVKQDHMEDTLNSISLGVFHTNFLITFFISVECCSSIMCILRTPCYYRHFLWAPSVSVLTGFTVLSVASHKIQLIAIMKILTMTS